MSIIDRQKPREGSAFATYSHHKRRDKKAVKITMLLVVVILAYVAIYIS